MYQTVRRAGKRYIVSKLNSGANNGGCQEKPTNLQQHQQKLCSSSFKNYSMVHKVNSFPVQKNWAETLRGAACSKHSKINRKVLPTFRNIHTVSKATLFHPSLVENTLAEEEIDFKKGFTGFLVSSKCCPGDTFVDQRTGNSTCRKCGTKYHWEDFLNKYCSQTVKIEPVVEETIVTLSESPQSNSLWINSGKIQELSNLPSEKLALESYHIYNVRITPEKNLLFPYYDISKQNLVKYKVSRPSGDEIVKIETDESASLFGWCSIRETDRTVVLTSSELDCLSVWHSTGIPSLAISSSSLPPSIFPFLEQFDKIILWFNDCYHEQENLQNFSRKLNLHRCWRITSPHSALSLLEKNGADDVTTCIRESRNMSHDRILTFKDLKSDLYNELVNAKKNAGVQFTRFPVLNEYLKGHRRGELTVFTGPTGSGKTTFLSELSLDLCLQGVKTLWGSFEIKNLRLLNTLMHQYAGFAIQNHMHKFMKWSENFENLPMYFMTYYGAQNLQDVINTIEYSVYTLDIEHVIIDNLQFMMSTQGSTDDRFQAMDRAIAAFRRCASDHNIHITVVVHPRKENDGGALQTASIYGSAKASQEADNVFILQTSDQLSMQVTKNRFCGSVGVLPLSFHPESLCLSGFHRNVETEEEILPALRVRRPVSNVKIFRKKDS